jgi:hypothetical protein
MSESIESANMYNAMPTRLERAKVYIGDLMSQEEREEAQIIATGYEDLERPMTQTAVLIPVAAHQDSKYIYNTLEEYSKQRGNDPFTIFAYLNAPIDNMHDHEVTVSRQEIFRANEDFPQLDIRAVEGYYDKPAIGKIRRDMWNAALLLAHHEGLLDPGMGDIIGINNDIDTHRVSPHYIARIQQYYKLRQSRATSVGMPEAPLRPVGTRVTHAVLPTHPNVGKVTNWIDNTYFQSPSHISYEAGVVIPFSHYALLGGFNPSAESYETGWVSEGKRIRHLTGAHLYTSPRRYIDRVGEHGTEGIWASGTFGANDTCRSYLRPDISQEQADDLIIDRLYSDLTQHWLYGALKNVYDDIDNASVFELTDSQFAQATEERAKVLVERQLQKAGRLLHKLVGSPLLADILNRSFDGDNYATSQVTSIIAFNRVLKSEQADWDKLNVCPA